MILGFFVFFGFLVTTGARVSPSLVGDSVTGAFVFFPFFGFGVTIGARVSPSLVGDSVTGLEVPPMPPPTPPPMPPASAT